MATCTCDCCNPDTPTTLNYTTKEINQILADEAATVTYKATDSLGQEHTYVNSGTWGPPEGFNMPADYEAITPWTITFSEPGIYKYFNKLVDAKEGTLYAELYTTIQVEQS